MAEAAAAATAAPPKPAAKENRKPKVELSSSQKAAAVIVALGAEKASLLYKYMEPEDVELLTLEVARMGFLDSEQTEEVLNEFYQICLTNKAVTEGGLEYARTVLEKAYGEQAASDLLSKVTKSLKNRDFAFMDKADVKSLLSALQNERPQTIALVLSYVDADKAAGVVSQLDERKQIQVVESIAKIDSVSPMAIKIIQDEMQHKFSSIMTSTNIKVGGIDYVADVMNNLDRTSEKNIFDGLADHDQELADEIRKRMFVFEDIVTMDDRSVQRFVRDCDPRDLVLSLKAANSEVANKLFSNMSSRMAQNIKDDLEITSNVRMKDVEEAQQRIVGIIRGLEEKGEIIILKAGKDDIIA
ncbi:MAG: flagellar motor switch protein FliG [Oscillibacter sp.]|jgi:flagellar motor switch protein FliG|nr:flagellar motor switch protein FliG [Oscillibacter sp.]MCI8689704.1 flagellar motor switch protein FliG [Oscillibacter sp.]MCI8848400.1 flagellar motor switch protein FliG [Oscillibacter sp.]MCI9375414.1 flagellar motor switch protein FliG [Oscillibacter sp.]